MGWIAAKDRIYDEKTIFGYINGGAEVYKAYHMRACLSRRYVHTSQAAIVLDIFDMGSSEDAFGVFTHDTDGQAINIGQDARFRPGWLSFWKSRFFVSIYMEEESLAAANAVKALGREIAANITAEGQKPHLLSLLPSQGLQAKKIRYLHHPIVLNYHYYISDQNILHVSHKTPAVLAQYLDGKEEALLLLISYPVSETTALAASGFLKHYLADADPSGAARLENGKWSVVKAQKRLLAIILESTSRKYAFSLLDSVFAD